jgi:hypothetical protein
MQSQTRIVLPAPDGTQVEFRLFEYPMMEAPLAAKYPQIKTYTAIKVGDERVIAKVDFTVFGLHAMVLDGDNTWFIDPYTSLSNDWYVVYYKKNYRKKGGDYMHCELDETTAGMPATGSPISLHDELPTLSSYKTNGSNLRNYRLALACTEEYSTAVGGATPTKASVLSAMVTSMNRVNGVFEKEFSMHANLVGNNDTLIFLPGSGDPYTNNSGSTMLGQNQTTCNNYIGSANYDFGHVFSTGGGGVAQLACVCGSSKARGVTGSSNPVGDAFDIDYVAHEMGHQYGGNHTFNGNTGSCQGNGNSSTAYEPGSGTTIMAYAGICAPQDVASHSDAFFHTASFDEIVNYTTISTGNNCPVQTPTGNNAPVITSIGSNVSIPLSTPFMLTGAATDPDGDTLTYSWEEYDLGPAGAPSTPTGTAPLFRSLAASLNPTRIIPRVNYIISNNANPLGEKLPTYGRAIKFRLTARDNKAGGGGVTYDPTLLTVNAVNTGAPFLVTNPNVLLTWPALSQQTVTWDVAGTTAAPVSAANVDITLSTDGGFTYPITLATAVANNGSCGVTMPNLTTNTARIMVKPTNNIFFDISNKNFIISAPQGVLENVMVNQQVIVSPNPSTTNIVVAWLGDYAGNYDLQLFDMQGRLVKSTTGAKLNVEISLQMNIDEINSGVYNCIIQTTQGRIIKKLIKQ